MPTTVYIVLDADANYTYILVVPDADANWSDANANCSDADANCSDADANCSDADANCSLFLAVSSGHGILHSQGVPNDRADLQEGPGDHQCGESKIKY